MAHSKGLQLFRCRECEVPCIGYLKPATTTPSHPPFESTRCYRSAHLLSTMRAVYLCWWSTCCLLRVLTQRWPSRRRDDWSTLTPSIIDALVKTLKRTRRWKRDGPSLRLLNKYWSRQIDHHVTTVYPHASRVIRQEDVASLLKFSNLTSVYLSAFLVTQRPHGSLSGSEGYTHFPAEQHRERVELKRVIGILAPHPALSCLEFNSDFFTRKYHHLRADAYGIWSQLSGITALRVSSTRDPCDWRDDRILDERQIPLQAWLDESDIVDLCRFSEYFPSLKSMDICFSCDRMPKQFESLQGLESLKLRVRGTENIVISLSEWVSIQSMDIIALQPDFNVVPLIGLPCIRSVTLHITDEAMLSHPAFFAVLRRLEALDLSVAPPAIRLAIPDGFFYEATSLQALALRHFHFSGWHLMPHLMHLRTLTLVSCTVQSGSAFAFRPNCLYSLSLTDMFRSHPTYTPFTRAAFPKIRVLALDSVQNDQAMEAICTLVTLEVLCIENASNVTIRGIEALRHLGKLRVLEAYGWVLGNSGVQLLSQEFLKRLERFHFSGIAWTRGVQRRLERLKRAAPQLIVSHDE